MQDLDVFFVIFYYCVGGGKQKGFTIFLGGFDFVDLGLFLLEDFPLLPETPLDSSQVTRPHCNTSNCQTENCGMLTNWEARRERKKKLRRHLFQTERFSSGKSKQKSQREFLRRC